MEKETESWFKRKIDIKSPKQTLYLPVLQFAFLLLLWWYGWTSSRKDFIFSLFVASLVPAFTVLCASFFVCNWAEAEVNDSHFIFLDRINSNRANLQPMNPEKPQRQSVEVVTRHQRPKQEERKNKKKKNTLFEGVYYISSHVDDVCILQFSHHYDTSVSSNNLIMGLTNFSEILRQGVIFFLKMFAFAK